MARGIFSGGMWDLQWQHLGSSVAARGTSPQARSQAPAPCTGSVESSPLVHQGSPWPLCYYFLTSVRGLWPICAALFYFAVWLCWVSLAARGFRAVGSDHPCPLCWKADSCPLGHQGSPLCVIFKCRCLMMVQLAPCPDHVLSPWGCLTSSENDPEPYLSKAVRAPLGSERVSKRLWDGPGWGWTGPGSLVGPRRDHFFLQ